ncbi:transcriptional regulator [Salmonella enterica]|nr:transcriptional regulator [Salmonella enterica subsp. enterica]EBR2768112.1 transcriptional regulator [Salmonella enterica]ECT8451065.1 transcriptional regulator [Salmonella enterica subsp. enterica serovar Thompson]EED9463092.1 transcriptional regulator [Salmonella enterica subsp. enterica serovar Abaetetuba]EBS8015117.1 transcriptional regulator [Salmonella enterica]
MSENKMTKRNFDIVIKLSAIHSPKVIMALEKYYVQGDSRKEACLESGLCQSYFSISMRKFESTLFLIRELLSNGQYSPFEAT